jgi:cell division protease FtsH
MIERMVHERDYSDETAKVIDDEVEALITEAANRARLIVKANLHHLEKLKDHLIEKETVDADEVDAVLKGAKMPAEATIR